MLSMNLLKIAKASVLCHRLFTDDGTGRGFGIRRRLMKYHIEKNTVQETLVIPLFGRLVCSERFPEFLK